jgi:hypothetical protein
MGPISPSNTGQPAVSGFLENLFCRPRMYGVANPGEFLQMLLVIDHFLDGNTDPHFYHVWRSCLASDTSDEPFETCVERMQDDWFRARSLSKDDSVLVRSVLQHRARWSGQVVEVPDFQPTVEIKIDVHYVPLATCTECSTLMASRLKDGLVWFWCPICDQGLFIPEGNIRRDAVRTLFESSFSIQSPKFVWDTPPAGRPDFDFGQAGDIP